MCGDIGKSHFQEEVETPFGSVRQVKSRFLQPLPHGPPGLW